MTPPTPPAPVQPNILGNVSLTLGIASAALVFGLGVCALEGVREVVQDGVQWSDWLSFLVYPLFVCGSSSVFIGVVGAALGVGGLFGGRQTSKNTAVVGLVLSLLALCLALAALAAWAPSA